MNRILGYLMVLSCPFIGGLIAAALIAALGGWSFATVAGIHCLAWAAVYALWFSGSEAQRSLES